MQKKKIILLTILILIILSIALLILNAPKQTPQPLTEQAKANYTTQIGEQTYDITNAVLQPNEIVPTISAGMIPIKWNGANWVITTFDDTNWYDYAIGKPAYIMLNDGYYQSELIQNMQGKELAENAIGNDALVVPNAPNNNPTIYMWIPRFAYNKQGEILYIKQGCSVAGTYTIPEIFTYETEKIDFSLAGIWVEYTPLENTSTVNTKINNMTGENNKYGFIANTIATNANNETSYKTTIETYNQYIANIVNGTTGASFPTDSTTKTNTVGAGLVSARASEEQPNTVGGGVPDDPQIDDISNPNRTILKITNSNQIEPIKGNAYYDETEEKIKIEVTYRTNAITKILDKKGNILSENSTIADTGEEVIGNGAYRYTIIDNLGNMKQISTKVEGLKIYVIPDLETLKEFRDEVNSGNNFEGITVIQTADIQMNKGKYIIDDTTGEITFAEDAEQWISIGKDYNLRFKGSYNGENHTIKGIYVNNMEPYQGLFGICDNAIIENIGIEESCIIGKNDIGGISGFINMGTINNCHNTGNIKGEESHVGGIVGNSGDTVINKCYNSGRIEGEGYVGGIVGGGTLIELGNCYNLGDVYGINQCIGGIAGDISTNSGNRKISNIYNTGNITGDGATGGCFGISTRFNISNTYNVGDVIVNGAYAEGMGGIVGEGNGTINNCYNYGKIEGKEDCGGIVGGYRISACTISNCYNVGNIEGSYMAIGGIAGYGNVSNSYNIGNIQGGTYHNGGIVGIGSADYCYNRGNLLATGYVGGINGDSKKVSNSYSTGNITSNGSYIGGISAYSQNKNNNYFLQGTVNNKNSNEVTGQKPVTEEELKQLSRTLGIENWKDDIYNINDGFPILSWQTDNDKLNLINGDNAFVEDTEGINNGYPLLAWQVETSD